MTSFVSFANGVLAGDRSESACLLAEVMRAAAGSVDEGEWRAVWDGSLCPQYHRRGTPDAAREKIAQAAAAFAARLPEVGGFLADLSGSTPLHRQLVGDVVALVGPTAAAAIPRLLAQVPTEASPTADDFTAAQYSKLLPLWLASPCDPDSVSRFFRHAHARVTSQSRPDSTGPLRILSTLLSTCPKGVKPDLVANTPDSLLSAGLSHRTRGTRKLAVALVEEKCKAAAWFAVWKAAFTVLSDEQPWHLVRPPWEDVVACGGLEACEEGAAGTSIPEVWSVALVARACCHADRRVVRAICQDVLSTAGLVPLGLVEAVIPSALPLVPGFTLPHENSAQTRLFTCLTDHLLAAPGVPSLPAARCLLAAVNPSLVAPRQAESLTAAWSQLVASWKSSGAADAAVEHLAAAALQLACACLEEDPYTVHPPAAALALLSAPSMRASVALSGVSADSRRLFVEAAVKVGLQCWPLLSWVSLPTLSEHIATLEGSSKFEACVACLAHEGSSSVARADGTFCLAGNVFEDSFLKEALRSISDQPPSFVYSVCALLEAGPPDALASLILDQVSTTLASLDIAQHGSSEADSFALICAACPAPAWRASAAAAAKAWVECPQVPASSLPEVALERKFDLFTALAAAARHHRNHAATPSSGWLCAAAADLSAEATPPVEAREKGKKKKKSQKPPRWTRPLAGALRCCCAADGGGAEAPRLRAALAALWTSLARFPVKFPGSRETHAALFEAAVLLGSPAPPPDRGETAGNGSEPRGEGSEDPEKAGAGGGGGDPRLFEATFPGLEAKLASSSLVASELTRVLVQHPGYYSQMAALALLAPAPQNQVLDAGHPAVTLAESAGRRGGGARVDPDALVAHLLSKNRSCDEASVAGGKEGYEGSETHRRHIRFWWLMCALTPQVSVETARLIALSAASELHGASLIPQTRVLAQNTWAVVCALHPTAPEAIPAMLRTLRDRASETRNVVSTLVVAAHLIVAGKPHAGGPDGHALIPAELLAELVEAVFGWAMATPHTARTHAQLIVAEYLDTLPPESPAGSGGGHLLSFLGEARLFFAENPHLKALRSAAGLERFTSLYLSALPPFAPANVESKVLKAMRLVQNRFSELDGERQGADAAGQQPAAGWASKEARKCPARARGGGCRTGDEACNPDAAAVDDGGGEDSSDSVENDASPPPNQCRPLSRRPVVDTGVTPEICVVGSFLDNLPNQAGLCRTLEALFGGLAECTLASSRVVQEPAFLRMSMASERWLKILEVPPGERLATYLLAKRADGFRIVAVEQTQGSVSAPLYTFHRKTVLVVGNEQLGIPAWLLRRAELVHDYVELPLDGASRSLNAHVTAAAMLWQYKMQVQ
ncbi:tRNA (guanosine(18)-2prime-O)-methyltransferase [Diplonema papillatum]|nr:tRNA (guanosine(18)-2prime-O)-methyltransferase [Diplonema papillatum]